MISESKKVKKTSERGDKESLGISVKKGDDFSEWYTQVVLKSELTDYSSGKGFTVLRPYGFELWEQVKYFFDSEIRKTGHKNAYFPTLIPESLLRKEAEHFAGFIPEVFWVTQAGNSNLADKYAVRPTSETIIHDSMARWIRSWRDLPMLLNVWNSVLRAEIKSTKPFIRSAEFLWQEGHTAHSSEKEAEDEVMQILIVYRQLMEQLLAVPVLVGRKSDKEKFVGAIYTMTLEAMMPDGRAIQMGTSHQLGQNFSKPFEIRFLGEDSELHFVWQTSWGVSWRLIGATVMTHGDDRGLILPPKVAPLQIVLIPIVFSSAKSADVIAKCHEIGRQLTTAGLRILVDSRENYTPGWKFNEWELKGVPVRIEIGPRDVANNSVVVVRRDTFAKESVPDSSVVEKVKATLEQIQSSLFTRAQERLEKQTQHVETYEELGKTIEDKGGFVRAIWCGSEECEIKAKNDTGADIRLISLDEKAESDAACIVCRKPGSQVVYFAHAY